MYFLLKKSLEIRLFSDINYKYHKYSWICKLAKYHSLIANTSTRSQLYFGTSFVLVGPLIAEILLFCEGKTINLVRNSYYGNHFSLTEMLAFSMKSVNVMTDDFFIISNTFFKCYLIFSARKKSENMKFVFFWHFYCSH